ncbi:MAG: hypothetical protein R2710_13790 [Acidimicrobiales bacterium]
MKLLRALIVVLGFVLLASCGGDGGSDSAGSDVTTDEGDNEGELDASGSEGEPVEIVTGELEPVSGCYVTASEVDLTPVWAGQAPGLAVAVSRDDQVIYTTQPADADTNGTGAFSDVDVELGTAYRYSVETIDADGNRSEAMSCGSGQLLAQSGEIACGVRVSDVGLPEVSWDGVLLVQKVTVLRNGTEVGSDVTSPFADIEAPVGAASEYSIVVADSTDQGRAEQTIACGEATPNVAEAGGTFDLAGAIEASDNFPSPYQYVRLQPICPGCDDTIELYLVPSTTEPTGHEVAQAWANGSATDPTGQQWAFDPLDAASVIDEAQRAGAEVTYEIDIDTGLVRSWTIDGVGVKYECVEVDTAPIDMRDRACTVGIFND